MCILTDAYLCILTSEGRGTYDNSTHLYHDCRIIIYLGAMLFVGYLCSKETTILQISIWVVENFSRW